MLDTQSPAINLVRKAANRWADKLIDFSHRNTLLYFKDRRTTLDLSPAPEDRIGALLAGQKLRLRELFPDQTSHEAACAVARGLRRKLVELEEEQGVRAGWVTRGMVCMDQPYTKGSVPTQPLRAPLVMHQLVLESRTATESDFTIELPEPPELNPVLLYALERQYGVEADIRTLDEKLSISLTEAADPDEQLRAAYRAIADAVAPSGLSLRLESAMIAGVFSFHKLPMVEDLRKSDKLLASHPVIGAMAGVEAAKQELRVEPLSEPGTSADHINPSNEFLVHDADSSQQRAIDAVMSGRHVVIEGPPGTGKSQTIANVIGYMAATGRTVLFVSEKRAAIEAVMNRLGDVGLDRLIFDLHDRKLTRRRVAQRIAEVLSEAGAEPPVEADSLHRRLVDRRNAAQRHPAELHEARQPWGLSAFDVITGLLSLPQYDVSRYNLRSSRLLQLDSAALDEVRDELRAFVHRGGLRVWRGDSPWSRSTIRSEDEVRRVLVHLDELAAGALHDAQQRVRELVEQADLDVPDDLAAWTDLFELLSDIERSITRYGEQVFSADLDDFVYAAAPRRLRPRRPDPLGVIGRTKVRRRLRRTCPDAPRKRSQLHEGLVAAVDQRERWRKLSRQGSGPMAVVGLDTSKSSFSQVRNHLAAVAATARIDGLERGPVVDAQSTVAELRNDQETLFRMPDLSRQQQRFRSLGLAAMLDDLAARDATSDEAAEVLQHAWLQVVFDEMRLQVPHLGQFVGRQHTAVIEDFRTDDRKHIELTAARVRRNVAVHLRKVRDRHPEQNALVRREAAKKSRHLTLRKLLGAAPNVLLAAFPCWAMSPLVVSSLLPAERLFDVVIFDEASQVEPQDAIASIMRGTELVVAGDPKQLPPTPFFRRLLQPSDSAEDDEGYDDLEHYESILDVLSGLISERHRLSWHYRSRDERLVAFSNVEIYDRSLVTFPGVQVDSPLRLEAVDGRAVPGQSGSSPEEVARVVDLVLDHAALRADESLGVITMGQKHALRIERELRSRRTGQQDLDEFFSQDRPASQRFFIKSLENVQGDERDAIILSIGYAKTRDGRLPLRFGPLNQAGGERRLNVAVTRARRRITVVSAFSHRDMDPTGTVATKNRGPELLRRYLEFVALGGDELAARQHTKVELNGLERSVLAAVKAQGIAAVPQWGVSGYRIDLALAHPHQPGRMVLAVETDGHSYHQTHSARDRDRLRQEHLERLGWEFHRIWSSDWYSNPEAETARLIAHWRQAVERVDRGEVAATPTVQPLHVARPSPRPESRRGPRPPIPAGLRIIEYSQHQLVRLCHWLLSDQLQRDRDERLQEAMSELGFHKRGRVIVERLTAALEAAQQRIDREMA